MQDIQIHAQVHQAAGTGNSLSVHNVELCLLKRRSYFVFDYLDTGTGTDDIIAVLDGFHLPYFHADGRIEFQRTAAGGGFRVAEHNAHFFTNLIDKDRGAF